MRWIIVYSPSSHMSTSSIIRRVISGRLHAAILVDDQRWIPTSSTGTVKHVLLQSLTVLVLRTPYSVNGIESS